MLNILVAPNAFKHALSAQEAAQAIIEGLASSTLACHTIPFPVGDGGDGTCSLIHDALQGRRLSCDVHDPLGRVISANYSIVEDGRTAIIEMADASGIRLLQASELAPMQASSVGTGQMMCHALDQGVKRIVLGMGGSATVDGGCGILHALGVRFLDDSGRALAPIPQELLTLADIDLKALDPRLSATEIIVMCDVKNTLLGAQGAAPVFGPQKGASEEDIEDLAAFLENLSTIVRRHTGQDMRSVQGGGAAGGAAGGVFAVLNAALEDGIHFFLDLTGFDKPLAKADIVITGEGSLDEQTLEGKGPFGVASRAKQKGALVIGLAGRVPLAPSRALYDSFDLLMSITHEPCSLEETLQNTYANLKRTAWTVGNFLAKKMN